MGQYKKIMVDGIRLRALLDATGVSLAQISRDMGYGNTALNNKVKRGYLMAVDAKYLEIVYGITPKQYEIVSPDQKSEDETPEISHEGRLTQTEIQVAIEKAIKEHEPINYERLYKVIYSATYEAVKKAWAE